MTNRLILPTPLVSTDWLAHHLGDPDLRTRPRTWRGPVWQHRRVEPPPRAERFGISAELPLEVG